MKELHRELTEFFEHPLDPRAGYGVTRALQEHRKELADPASQPGPDAAARQKILSLKVEYENQTHDIPQTVANDLRDLSDDLQLNENLCVNLWVTVCDDVQREGLESALCLEPGALRDLDIAARRLWLYERDLKMQCIANIFKFGLDENMIPEKLRVLVEEAETLCRLGNLPENLMRGIDRYLDGDVVGERVINEAQTISASSATTGPGAALSANMRASTVVALADHRGEMLVRMAECLFFIFHGSSSFLGARETLMLVKLLRKCSSKLAEVAKAVSSSPHRPGGFGAAGLLDELSATPGGGGGASGRSGDYAAPLAVTQDSKFHGALFHTTTALLAAACRAFDQRQRLEWRGIETKEGGNPLLPLQGQPAPELADIESELRGRWQHRPVQGLVLVAFALLYQPHVLAAQEGAERDKYMDMMLAMTDVARVCRSFSFLSGPVLCARRFAATVQFGTMPNSLPLPPLVPVDAVSTAFYIEEFARLSLGYLQLRTVTAERLGGPSGLPLALQIQYRQVSYQYNHSVGSGDGQDGDGADGGSGGGAEDDQRAFDADFSGTVSEAVRQMEQEDADAIEDLILLIAALADLLPNFSEELWRLRVAERLCTYALEQLHECAALLPAWLQLLAALATAQPLPPQLPGLQRMPENPQSANVYDYLASHARGWNHLLRNAQQIAEYYMAPQSTRPNDQQQPYGYGGALVQDGRGFGEGKQPGGGGGGRGFARVPARVEEVYVAFSGLVQRCASDFHVRTSLFQTQQVHHKLFRLALAPISPRLRGALFKALAALAEHPVAAEEIWGLLEQANSAPPAQQPLAPVPNASEGAVVGLMRYVLNNVEAQQMEYPATEGFCCLVAQLLTTTIPYQLGRERRSPGPWPFVDFLVTDVLLQSTDRRYRQPGERWRLTSRVLQALALLVRRYPLSADGVQTSAVLDGAAANPSDADREELKKDFGPRQDYELPADAARGMTLAGGAGGGNVGTGQETVPRRKSPGFEIMWEMLSGDRLYAVVLGVLVGRSCGHTAALRERQENATKSIMDALLAAAKLTEPPNAPGRRASLIPEAAQLPLSAARQRNGALPTDDWGWWRARCETLALSLLDAVAERDGAFLDLVRRHDPPLSEALPSWCASELQRVGAAPLVRLAELLAQNAAVRRATADDDLGAAGFYRFGGGLAAQEPHAIPAIAMYVASESSAAAPLLASRLTLQVAGSLPQARFMAAATADTTAGPSGASRRDELVLAFAQRVAGAVGDAWSAPEGGLGTSPPQGADTDLMTLDGSLLGMAAEAAAAAEQLRFARRNEEEDEAAAATGGGALLEKEAAVLAASWADLTVYEVQRSIQTAALDLLLGGMEGAAPTFSHVLLDLEVVARDAGPHGRVSRATVGEWRSRFLQRFASGKPGAPLVSCLDALLRLLDSQCRTLMVARPEVARRGYELIYRLCSAPPTSRALLDLLRSNDIDFWYVHLMRVAAAPDLFTGTGEYGPNDGGEGAGVATGPKDVQVAAATGRRWALYWLLRAAAIELKDTTYGDYVSNARASRLLSGLFGDRAGEAHGAAMLAIEGGAGGPEGGGDDGGDGERAAAAYGCLPLLISALDLDASGPRQPDGFVWDSVVPHVFAVSEAAGRAAQFTLVNLSSLAEAQQERAKLDYLSGAPNKDEEMRRAASTMAWARQWNGWALELLATSSVCDAVQAVLGVSSLFARTIFSRAGRGALVATMERILRRLANEPCQAVLAAPLARGCAAIASALCQWDLDRSFEEDGGGVMSARQRAVLLRLAVKAALGTPGNGSEIRGLAEGYRSNLYTCCSLLLLRAKGRPQDSIAAAQAVVVTAERLAAEREQRRQVTAALEPKLAELVANVGGDALSATAECRNCALVLLGTVLATLTDATGSEAADGGSRGSTPAVRTVVAGLSLAPAGSSVLTALVDSLRTKGGELPGGNLSLASSLLSLLTRVACTAEGAKDLTGCNVVKILARTGWLTAALRDAREGASGAFAAADNAGAVSNSYDVVSTMWPLVLRLVQALLGTAPRNEEIARDAAFFVECHRKQIRYDLELPQHPSLEALRVAAAAGGVVAALSCRPKTWKETLGKSSGAEASDDFGDNSVPGSSSVGAKLADRMLGLLSWLGSNPYPPGSLDFSDVRYSGARGEETVVWWDAVKPVSRMEHEAASAAQALPPGVFSATAGSGALGVREGAGGVDVSGSFVWTAFDAGKLASSQELLRAAAMFHRQLPELQRVRGEEARCVADALFACGKALVAAKTSVSGNGAEAIPAAAAAAVASPFAAGQAAAPREAAGYEYLVGSLTFVVENLAAAAFCIAEEAARVVLAAPSSHERRLAQEEAERLRKGFEKAFAFLVAKVGGFPADAARQASVRLPLPQRQVEQAAAGALAGELHFGSRYGSGYGARGGY